MTNTKSTVARLSKAKQARYIDELGTLKAQIATLKDQYDQRVAIFKEFGEGVYEGNAFKLTVSHCVTQTLDNKIVKGFLTPAQIAQATVVNEFDRAIVSAR
jgi:hypothetical protein